MVLNDDNITFFDGPLTIIKENIIYKKENK